MSADIVILDNFAEFKRMLYSDSFKLIESEFKKEREKYLAKLLNNSTPDEEVIKIKAVINALDITSPTKLGESLMSRASKKTKLRYPELVR